MDLDQHSYLNFGCAPFGCGDVNCSVFSRACVEIWPTVAMEAGNVPHLHEFGSCKQKACVWPDLLQSGLKNLQINAWICKLLVVVGAPFRIFVWPWLEKMQVFGWQVTKKAPFSMFQCLAGKTNAIPSTFMLEPALQAPWWARKSNFSAPKIQPGQKCPQNPLFATEWSTSPWVCEMETCFQCCLSSTVDCNEECESFLASLFCFGGWVGSTLISGPLLASLTRPGRVDKWQNAPPRWNHQKTFWWTHHQLMD